MPKVTKFFGLHNEFFSQEIPIRNNSLTRIRVTFQGNVLFVVKTITFVINVVGGLKALNYIPFNRARALGILIIALISSPMFLSMKIQKKIVQGTRRFSKCIPWQLK